MPALSALLNYIGNYLRHFFCKNVIEMLVTYMVSTWNLFHFFPLNSLHPGREHMYKKGRPIDLKLWAKEMVKDWPEQENTADCGMFVVKAAEFFSRDAPVKFSQEDMPYFRKRMIWEVVNNTLISP